jgi:hypothetical protein
MLRRVDLVGTDVSEELSASFIRLTRIGVLGKKLAVNVVLFAASVGCKLELALFLVHRFLSPWWRRRHVSPKRRYLQEPHGVTSQKTPFFIVYSWLQFSGWVLSSLSLTAMMSLSSENVAMVLFSVACTLLIQSRYKMGPNTLPCGTQALVNFSSEYESSCLTRTCRLVK